MARTRVTIAAPGSKRAQQQVVYEGERLAANAIQRVVKRFLNSWRGQRKRWAVMNIRDDAARNKIEKAALKYIERKKEQKIMDTAMKKIGNAVSNFVERKKAKSLAAKNKVSLFLQKLFRGQKGRAYAKSVIRPRRRTDSSMPKVAR